MVFFISKTRIHKPHTKCPWCPSQKSIAQLYLAQARKYVADGFSSRYANKWQIKGGMICMIKIDLLKNHTHAIPALANKQNALNIYKK